jgi:glycosyltransferase involved in cell wall biosynthesis
VTDIFADLSISRKDAALLFHCLKDYGRDLLSGRKTLSGSIIRTPHAFNKIRNAILERLAGRDYTFTYQTQSLFDASLPGIPHFTYTDHTHLENLRYPGFDRGRILSPAWIACEKTIYHNASMNFTMSSNISRSMTEDYDCDPETVSCVFCGANVQAEQNEHFDDQRYAAKNVLFVGIDWERKGGPVLAEAFRTVLETHPDAQLTIVGCEPDIDLPNCKVVGKVPLSDVKKFFLQASVFCLPTTLEPFGIVFLEAMAHKLPVIGTRIGAIPDFISHGENGLMVQPDNATELADSITGLLDSPGKCKAFGDFGHRLFWNRYTWANTGRLMKKEIERITG